MKTPRARKSRSKHGRKLGKITLDTERSTCDSFGKELKEIPGHFMYNEENDAIQQVLKLPDISVNDGSGHNDGNKRGLSLPPISAEDKGYNEYIEHYGSQTKLPKINTAQPSNSVMNSYWLEKHDVSTISWKNALDVLHDKARDSGSQQQKRSRKESVKKC